MCYSVIAFFLPTSTMVSFDPNTDRSNKRTLEDATHSNKKGKVEENPDANQVGD